MIQFHHSILNLFLRVPGDDVLRAVPVERMDFEYDDPFNSCLVVRRGQLLRQFRMVCRVQHFGFPQILSRLLLG